MNEQHRFPSFNGGTCAIGHFYKNEGTTAKLLLVIKKFGRITSRDIVRLTTNFDRFAVKAKFPVSS